MPVQVYSYRDKATQEIKRGDKFSVRLHPHAVEEYLSNVLGTGDPYPAFNKQDTN